MTIFFSGQIGEADIIIIIYNNNYICEILDLEDPNHPVITYLRSHDYISCDQIGFSRMGV